MTLAVCQRLHWSSAASEILRQEHLDRKRQRSHRGQILSHSSTTWPSCLKATDAAQTRRKTAGTHVTVYDLFNFIFMSDVDMSCEFQP